MTNTPGTSDRLVATTPQATGLNWHDETGQTVAPRIVDGTFNSPHGITARGGAIYLTEWMIGGRVIQLRPTGAAAR